MKVKNESPATRCEIDYAASIIEAANRFIDKYQANENALAIMWHSISLVEKERDMFDDEDEAK